MACTALHLPPNTAQCTVHGALCTVQGAPCTVHYFAGTCQLSETIDYGKTSLAQINQGKSAQKGRKVLFGCDVYLMVG